VPGDRLEVDPAAFPDHFDPVGMEFLGVVDGRQLDGPDGHRIVIDVEHARAFARGGAARSGGCIFSWRCLNWI